MLENIHVLEICKEINNFFTDHNYTNSLFTRQPLKLLNEYQSFSSYLQPRIHLEKAS